MRKDTGLSPHSQTPICTSVWTWQGAGAWGGGCLPGTKWGPGGRHGGLICGGPRANFPPARPLQAQAAQTTGEEDPG